MDRRGFLKSVAAAYAALHLPKVAVNEEIAAEIARFNPLAEYGQGVLYSDEAELAEVAQLLARSARTVLPLGTKFSIRLSSSRQFFGEYKEMYWLYSPKGYPKDAVTIFA